MVSVVQPLELILHRSWRGFTLIELLTVIALVAILTTLAAPGMQAFLLRNRVASLSNEFTGALQQTRALAIAKNSCVSLCASTTVNQANTGTCAATPADDFQAGWLIFQNPACDAAQTDPTAASGEVLVSRTGEANRYSIRPSVAALSIVMFDPRGFANLAATGNFQIATPNADADYRRTVCLDAAGRATVRKYTAACL